MQKLIINTQYMENYGDKVNPYLKFKGGSTYVMFNVGTLNENEIATHVARIRPFITTDLEKSNGGSEEFIIDSKVMNHADEHCADFETATQFYFKGTEVHFMKVTDNRVDGWMRKEILEQTENWVGVPKGPIDQSGRGSYKSEYLMEDGDIVNGQNGLKDWFATAEVA